MKVCLDCKEELPLEDFLTDYKGRIYPRCTPCLRIKQRRDKDKNIAAYELRGGPALAEKLCRGCDTVKPASEFYPHKQTKHGLSTKCKLCVNAREKEAQRKRRELDPEGTKKRLKLNYVKCVYKLSAEDYEKLLITQDHKCAICKKSTDNLYVDHCHTEGHVRGLLCPACNSAIGQLKEDPKIFLSALRYLGFGVDDLLTLNFSSDEGNFIVVNGTMA